MQNRDDSKNFLFLKNINRVYDLVITNGATKQETELRVAHIAELVAKDNQEKISIFINY